MKCRHTVAYQTALHVFPSTGFVTLFLTDLLTDLSKTDLKRVNVNRINTVRHTKMLPKLFPESKNELWNCDASVSGCFIVLLVE